MIELRGQQHVVIISQKKKKKREDKLLGPPRGLLTWSLLTFQPIKCYYLCKCNITRYFLFFIPYTDQKAHSHICIDDIISLVGKTTSAVLLTDLTISREERRENFATPLMQKDVKALSQIVESTRFMALILQMELSVKHKAKV